jgi:hypothetical protein
MRRLDQRQMLSQPGADGIGEEGYPVAATLAAPDDELSPIKIGILDPQLEAFEEPEPAAIEELGHQEAGAAQPVEDGPDLGPAEDDGEPLRPLGAHDATEPAEVAAEHVAIEEEESAQRLVLGGGADPALRGEMGEVARDVSRLELGWMARAVEMDEAADPGT